MRRGGGARGKSGRVEDCPRIPTDLKGGPDERLQDIDIQGVGDSVGEKEGDRLDGKREVVGTKCLSDFAGSEGEAPPKNDAVRERRSVEPREVGILVRRAGLQLVTPDGLDAFREERT